MEKIILINSQPREKRVAILEDGSLEDFFVERQEFKGYVGNIYKGKVDSVLQGIAAAFVDIGLGKNGFLYVTDAIDSAYESESFEELEEVERKPRPQKHINIHDVLKKGQDVIVQVVKEPFGTKGPRLTSHATIPGRNFVLMPGEEHIGISKKIVDPKERDRIRNLLKRFKLPKDTGLIVRTAASGRKEKELIREIKYLINLSERIQQYASKSQSPSLIYEEVDLVLRVVRDVLTEEYGHVYIDSKEEYKRIMRFLNSFSPQLKNKIKLFNQNVPLFESFKVEEEIRKIYERKINLKSKGYIVIEQTEGLVAIDVNTGKFVSRNLEDTAFITNLEAAKEVGRQIRLRDMGGIIVIDFIDMESRDHQRKVYAALEEAVRKDKAKTNILGFSSIGLVEMTRQRMRKSLESMIFEDCPCCNGRGLLKTNATVAIEAIRSLETELRNNKRKIIVLIVHPVIAKRVHDDFRQHIFHLEREHKSKVMIKEDSEMHLEGFKFEIRNFSKI